MRTPPLEFALKRHSFATKSRKRKDWATSKKNPALLEGGITRGRFVAARSGLPSTDSNLARFDRFGLGQVDRQKTLLDASADARRVDARVEIKNPTISSSYPFSMHRFSEIGRRNAMTSEDQFSVLHGYLHSLLAYSRHLHFQGESVRILMKVHHRRGILHALPAFIFCWC